MANILNNNIKKTGEKNNKFNPFKTVSNVLFPKGELWLVLAKGFFQLWGRPLLRMPSARKNSVMRTPASLSLLSAVRKAINVLYIIKTTRLGKTVSELCVCAFQFTWELSSKAKVITIQ